MSHRRFRRRTLLASVLVGALAACTRPTERLSTPATEDDIPERQRWEREARGILTDVLETLRTFEIFVAFRQSAAATSGMLWDPPTTAAWNEALHVTRGIHGRAGQLLQQISAAPVNQNVWRERRELAESAHSLLDLGDALIEYRTRIDYLAPGGDGSSSWAALERAWAQWEASAALWGLSRAEPIPCAR